MKRLYSSTVGGDRETKKQKKDGSSPFLSYLHHAKDALVHGGFLDGYDITILRLVNKEMRAAISPKWGVSVTRALLSLCDQGELEWLEANNMPFSNTDLLLSFVGKPHDQRDLDFLNEYYELNWTWCKETFAHCCTTLVDTRSFELVAPTLCGGIHIEWIKIIACEGTEAMKHWFRRSHKDTFYIMRDYCKSSQWDVVRALIALNPKKPFAVDLLLSDHPEATAIYFKYYKSVPPGFLCFHITSNYCHWMRAIVSHEHAREELRTIVAESLVLHQLPSLSRELDFSPEMACILSSVGIH
jgi:hypothetical protein